MVVISKITPQSTSGKPVIHRYLNLVGRYSGSPDLTHQLDL